MTGSSFKRRNSDWQAYGQHRRRAAAYRAVKKRHETAQEYQARFERENRESLEKEQEK